MKPGVCSLKTQAKLINFQPDLARRGLKISWEGGEITNTTEIQGIIREYYKNYLPTNWITQKLWINSQEHTMFQNSWEEIENLNRPVTSNKIRPEIKTPPKQDPGSDGFTGEFQKTFKGELTYPPTTIPKKVKEKIPHSSYEASIILMPKPKTLFPHSFYEASIILIPKPDKDNTKKELWANIPEER